MRTFVCSVCGFLCALALFSGCVPAVSVTPTPTASPEPTTSPEPTSPPVITSPLTAFSLSQERSKVYSDPVAGISFSAETSTGTITIPPLNFGALEINQEELYVIYEVAEDVTAVEYRTNDGTGYSDWSSIASNAPMPFWKESDAELKVSVGETAYIYTIEYSEAAADTADEYISFGAEVYCIAEKSVVQGVDYRLFIIRGYRPDMTKEVVIELQWNAPSPIATPIPPAGTYSALFDTSALDFASGFTMLRFEYNNRIDASDNYSFYFNPTTSLVNDFSLTIGEDGQEPVLSCDVEISIERDFRIQIAEDNYSYYQGD